jgi:hypothetical protein
VAEDLVLRIFLMHEGELHQEIHSSKPWWKGEEVEVEFEGLNLKNGLACEY